MTFPQLITRQIAFLPAKNFLLSRSFLDRFVHLYRAHRQRGKAAMVLWILLTALATFFITELVGFLVHRLAHWPKAGKLFRDHLDHHAKFYPPSSYLSERYLGDIRTSFLPWFVLIFLAFNLLAGLILPWPLSLTFFVVCSTVSLMNSYLHDSFHVENHWLTKFHWHHKMREIHRVHHQNVRVNLGIYWYFFDRLGGTFRPSSSRPTPGPHAP